MQSCLTPAMYKDEQKMSRTEPLILLPVQCAYLRKFLSFHSKTVQRLLNLELSGLGPSYICHVVSLLNVFWLILFLKVSCRNFKRICL